MKVYTLITETKTTEDEFITDVFVSKSAQLAGELAVAAVNDMCEAMKVVDVDPTITWEIKGDGWFFRARVEEQEI